VTINGVGVSDYELEFHKVVGLAGCCGAVFPRGGFVNDPPGLPGEGAGSLCAANILHCIGGISDMFQWQWSKKWV